MTPDEIYKQGLIFAKGMLEHAQQGLSLDGIEIKTQVQALMSGLQTHEDELLVLSERNTPDNYLISHAINCTILSLVIGRALRFNDDQLLLLGTCTMLHDIGMVRLLDKILQAKKFTKKDYEEVKSHVIYGVEILKSARNLDASVIEAASGHHEREDGTGYPGGLKQNEIHEITSIVSLVEVYEAITHPRPYKDKKPAFVAIEEIIKTRKLFKPRVVKALLDRLTIFPMGTLVQLNTKAIGRVVKINTRFPMRPDIQILVDHKGNVPEKTIILPLLSDVNLHVTRCLTEEEYRSKT